MGWPGLNPGGVGKDQDVERTQLVVQLLQQATYAFEGGSGRGIQPSSFLLRP